MNMPLKSKIVSSSQSPVDKERTKAEASQMSGKTDNASYELSGGQTMAGKLADKVENYTAMPDSNLDSDLQKVLVSGSMTIKTQMAPIT